MKDVIASASPITQTCNRQAAHRRRQVLASVSLTTAFGRRTRLQRVEERYGLQVDEPFRYNKMKFSDVVADIEAMVCERNDSELPDRTSSK